MRKKKRKLEIAMTALILMAAFAIGRYTAEVVETNAGVIKPGEEGEVLVVVDPGHGGFDSGKVGINDALEKDLNLVIAKRLKLLLEKEGIQVIMTREEDQGLYDEGEANKKQQDMKRRCEIINETKPAAAVSIHQNSYTEEYVCGPQVFFYETSEEGRKLATVLQESLNTVLEIERPREIKSNDTYYLLRKTEAPTVIVECGFLSNSKEANRLTTEEYQEEVAEAISRGVVEYLNR